MHLLQERIVGREAVQRRQVQVEPRLAGLQCDRPAQRRDGLAGAAELAQQVTAIGMGLGKSGCVPDGGVVAGQGLVRPHQLLQLLAAVVQGDRIGGIGQERLVDAREGLGVAAQARQHDAAVVEAGDMARVKPQDGVVTRQRLLPATAPHRRGGAIEGCGGIGQVRIRRHARSSNSPTGPGGA